MRKPHIEGALHIPLPKLTANIGKLLKQSPVAVICGSGYRSSVAARLLQRHGFSRVQNVMGGMAAYQETQLPGMAGSRFGLRDWSLFHEVNRQPRRRGA